MESDQKLDLSALNEGKKTEQTVLYPALLPSTHLSNALASAGKNVVYRRVGKGKILDPDSLGKSHCGEVIAAVGCPSLAEGHDRYLLTDSCGRLQCPKDYHAAVSRAAHRVAERIDGMDEAWRINGVELGKLKHIAFSPPQRDWPKFRVTADMGKSLRKELNRYLKRIFKDKAYGGVLIFHGERKKHLDGSECHHPRCSEVHEWVWSPHFHYLGYGYIVPDSARFYQDTGWIYKNIGSQQQRDAYLTVNYQLSHAGIWLDLNSKEWKQIGSAYWMVGLMSNSKGGRKVLHRSMETIPCTVCQKALHDFGVSLEVIDWHDDKGEHQRPILVVEYYINDKAKGKTYLQQSVEGFELDLVPLPKE